MKAPPVIRPLTDGDSDVLLKWRNHPESRRHFGNPHRVSPDEHRRWVQEKLSEAGTRIFIAEVNEKPAGVVRFERREDEVVVSVNVDPAYSGVGIGTALVQTGTQKYQESFNGSAAPIVAYVKKTNPASSRLFEKCGYVRKKSTEDMYVYYNDRTSLT